MARFCTNCGTRRLEGARFCVGCGDLVDSDPDPVTSAEFKLESHTEADPPTLEQFSSTEVARPRWGISRRNGLFVGAGLVCLLALGGVLWWSDRADPSATPQANSLPAKSAPPRRTATVGQLYDLSLMPVAIGNRCGFADESGLIVINPQFDVVGLFGMETGVAPVRVASRWGLLDRQGRFAVDPQFENLEPILNTHLFIAKIGGRYGIINTEGAFVVNPQFDEVHGFDAQMLTAVRIGSKFGIIDVRGNFILSPRFDDIRWYSQHGDVIGFTRGLVPAKVGQRWGFIDRSGNWVIAPQFNDAKVFAEIGLAAVQTDEGASNRVGGQSPWGYVDRRGRLAIAPQYEFAGEFRGNGLAPAQVAGQFGYIDRGGVFRIRPQFDNALPFQHTSRGWTASAGMIVGRTPQGGLSFRHGKINQRGNYLINLNFDYMTSFDHNERSVVQIGNNYGLIDISGRYVSNPIYTYLRSVPGSGRYLYQRNLAENSGETLSEVGWIDLNGRVISTIRGSICSSER